MLNFIFEEICLQNLQSKRAWGSSSVITPIRKYANKKGTISDVSQAEDISPYLSDLLQRYVIRTT